MDELERIEVAGVVYMPIRRRLGVRAFGVNAYSAANAGDQVIELHKETGAGPGAHEELYLVTSGRAEFTVSGKVVDAPAGTLVFVPDLASERAAVAREPDTTVLVVGAPAAAPLPTSPFEYWFAAEPAYRSRDYDAVGGTLPRLPIVMLIDRDTASAAEILTAALQDHNVATVVGTRSFGKGLFQDLLDLSNGGELDLTVGEFFTADGISLAPKGIQPDVYAKDNPQTKADEGLQRALAVLEGEVAKQQGAAQVPRGKSPKR